MRVRGIFLLLGLVEQEKLRRIFIQAFQLKSEKKFRWSFMVPLISYSITSVGFLLFQSLSLRKSSILTWHFKFYIDEFWQSKM
ncbi:hypothetical protein SUGI_0328910 [Cryptomeria japonica]|nr:hypothetical protein SUGI_0328910 [Cryptomeria japonica]